MASIRAPFGTSQIRGSVGSVTFANNGSGLYLRERTVPVNPKTVPQMAIRGATSIVNTAWRLTLNGAQRDLWDQYAQSTPLPDGFGEPTNIGGKQQFLRTNNARLFVGLALLEDAPITPGVAESANIVFGGDTTDGIEGTVVSPTLAAGDIIIVRIGNAVNQTVNFYASPFRFAVGVTSVSPIPFLVKPDTEVEITQRYFLEHRLFAASGKVSFDVRDQVSITL